MLRPVMIRHERTLLETRLEERDGATWVSGLCPVLLGALLLRGAAPRTESPRPLPSRTRAPHRRADLGGQPHPSLPAPLTRRWPGDCSTRAGSTLCPSGSSRGKDGAKWRIALLVGIRSSAGACAWTTEDCATRPAGRGCARGCGQAGMRPTGMSARGTAIGRRMVAPTRRPAEGDALSLRHDGASSGAISRARGTQCHTVASCRELALCTARDLVRQARARDSGIHRNARSVSHCAALARRLLVRRDPGRNGK